MNAIELDEYLADCRRLTLTEIEAIIPKPSPATPVLYQLMLDYPLRQAKALRPALCIASCRALGGPLEAVLRSAAILELYHNAFLIHDDVEDGSESRRDRPTLHAMHGSPIAVNVGDAMLALALEPLLDNMRLLGLGKALRIMQAVARMARESTEGQAIELHWIRTGDWRLSDHDYIRMVYKKTAWYTFITPMLIGGIVANSAPEQLATLRKFAALLGIAFQIQDDVLNLTGEGDVYGKEIAGDLWEGKHTLILMHALRAASSDEREQACAILQRARPSSRHAPKPSAFTEVLAALRRRGELTAAAHEAITAALNDATADHGAGEKTADDIQYLMRLIERHGSIEYARAIARHFARQADAVLGRAPWLQPSIHRGFLQGIVDFVVQRDR